MNTQVCIIGAGPGGVATALKLSYMGIPCVLIDKATFPRDKICGDAVSGKVTTLLNRIDPAILERFTANEYQVDVWGLMFALPNGKELDIPFKANYVRDRATAPGYVCKRIDLDNFLIEEVKRRDNVQLYEGVSIAHYEQIDRGWRISDKNGEFVVETSILIDASGAHSQFSRKYGGIKKENAHYAGAVRAYFQGVKELKKDNFIELHFLKSLTPGYFWVFPLPNGGANVGLGMRSDFIAKNKVNLKAELERVILSPAFQGRFADAEMISKIEGYGLPLGSKQRPISGQGYMLVGDAGSLIDPLTGEGIGHAFYSGIIAAEQARDCIDANDFSAVTMKAYDVRVKRVLGTEMKLSYQLQRLMSYPRLVNIIGGIIADNKAMLDVLSRMYNDFDLRKQLVRPFFWIKMLFKKK